MIVSSLLFAMSAPAQELPVPPLSPRAEVMQEVGVVEVRVNYARPAKRDRAIFGELVPYGTLWRTGANAATTLEISDTVTVAGVDLDPGRYALLTIPGRDAWTVVLNRNTNLRGTSGYDETLDVVRFDVSPALVPARERLTFAFADVTDSSTTLTLTWASTQIAIPLSVPTREKLDTAVERYVARAARTLAQAARHYSRNGEHEAASATADLAIDVEEDWYTLWTKAEVLRAAEEMRSARRYARLAQRSGERAERKGESFPQSYAERIDKAIDDWR